MIWRLERHDTLPSTSDFCVVRARAGEAAGLAVLAYRQTAGRGSRGRAWLAPAGNLSLSALIRPSLPAAEAGFFALLAGLAVAEAIESLLPAIRPTLKWPNDVLLEGAKLAGVLIDAGAAAGGLDWLVIGIGVNLRHAPDIAGRPTTTLAAHGGAASAEDAAQAVLARLSYWLERLAAGEAPALLAAWQARAHPPGTPVEISAPGGAMRGTFAGLSPTGELLLRQAGKETRVNTGEVLLGGAETCCW